MQTYTYHIVNVFADNHFGGNPLAVFPSADGLTDQQMQAIAQQFNLSETPHCQNSCHPHLNNPNGGKGDNHGTIQSRTQKSNIKQTAIA